ncbi:MAG: hypothetical protein E6I92_02770 [Chloroflexi bacterium]|nr:MAG: hypothetical protein E6I92_02770 [Chloroflexota bacterium]
MRAAPMATCVPQCRRQMWNTSRTTSTPNARLTRRFSTMSIEPVTSKMATISRGWRMPQK